jgi:hypothetical protein
MMKINYVCTRCGEDAGESPGTMVCIECNGELRGVGCPGINGTRDSFGVRNSFIDEKSGDVIDNWNKWEKAGYRKVEKNNFKNQHAREAFENKKEELKGQRLKQLMPQDMPI